MFCIFFSLSVNTKKALFGGKQDLNKLYCYMCKKSATLKFIVINLHGEMQTVRMWLAKGSFGVFVYASYNYGEDRVLLLLFSSWVGFCTPTYL